MSDFQHVVSAKIEPSFADVIRGVYRVDGDLMCSNEHLEFRYKRTSFFGKNAVVDVWRAEFSDLREIKYRTIGSEPRIVVMARKLMLLDGLPGDNSGGIKFRVQKGSRSEAKDLVAFVDSVLSDRYEYEVAGVPFSLPDLETGFKEFRGLMYLEPGFLVLEIESTSWVGAEADRHTVKLANAAIQRCEYKRGVVFDRLTLRPVDPTVFDKLPWPVVGQLSLRIKRKHRAESEAIVRLVSLRQALPDQTVPDQPQTDQTSS